MTNIIDLLNFLIPSRGAIVIIGGIFTLFIDYLKRMDDIRKEKVDIRNKFSLCLIDIYKKIEVPPEDINILKYYQSIENKKDDELLDNNILKSIESYIYNIRESYYTMFGLMMAYTPFLKLNKKGQSLLTNFEQKYNEFNDLFIRIKAKNEIKLKDIINLGVISGNFRKSTNELIQILMI